MRWQNGSKFDRLATGACRVRLEKDIFLLIGGLERNSIGRPEEMNIVLRLNITEETVEELPPMKKPRAYHACEVSEKRILISGGLGKRQLVDDEVYNMRTNESRVLQKQQSLRRHHHHLLALGQTIFAFGGYPGQKPTRQIKLFDWTTENWKSHDQSLKSVDISDLAVTAFPSTAVDCHLGCSCGVAGDPGSERILGGSEADVRDRFLKTIHQVE